MRYDSIFQGFDYKALCDFMSVKVVLSINFIYFWRVSLLME